jgi:hypothetical protein
VYTFLSGTPIQLPTNTAFFRGGDPSVSGQTPLKWFDTRRFVP